LSHSKLTVRRHKEETEPLIALRNGAVKISGS